MTIKQSRDLTIALAKTLFEFNHANQDMDKLDVILAVGAFMGIEASIVTHKASAPLEEVIEMMSTQALEVAKDETLIRGFASAIARALGEDKLKRIVQ